VGEGEGGEEGWLGEEVVEGGCSVGGRGLVGGFWMGRGEGGVRF